MTTTRRMPLCTRDDGSIIEFIPSKEELYYYDFTHSINRKKEMGHTMIVNTVEELKRNFSKREIEVADKARRMYVMMGRPLDEIFESLIRRGKILNHPITVTDFKNAIKIYGKDLGCIKGKTTWTRTKRVVIDATSGPDQQLKVILSVDIMNFTGIFPYLVKQSLSQSQFCRIKRKEQSLVLSKWYSIYIWVKGIRWKKLISMNSIILCIRY
jgi:hypothetical protein